jgi:hypothetical protein
MVEGDVIDPKLSIYNTDTASCLTLPTKHHASSENRHARKKNNQTYCQQSPTLLKSQWQLVLLVVLSSEHRG